MVLEEDLFFRGSKVVGEDVEPRSLKGEEQEDGSVVLNQVFEAGEGMVIDFVGVVLLVLVLEEGENWRVCVCVF